MYVQVDKEEPDIGNIKGLNMAAVKTTTAQISNCRIGVLNKLMPRLLHIPALTDIPIHISI
jgi:hypothetical protein